MATEIICTGVDDTAAVQAAINVGGEIHLNGPCALADTLIMSAPDTSLISHGTVSSTISPAIKVTGHHVAVKQFRLSCPGIGIELNGSSRTFLRCLQINSGGDGLLLRNGAGLWAFQLHFNGTAEADSYAVRILSWDTAFFTDILSEEQGGGFRIGSGSIVGNILMSSVVLDRIRAIGILVEPSSGGNVSNVQMSNIWAAAASGSSAPAPILLNAQESDVSNIEIVNGRFSDFAMKEIWIAGPVQNFRQSNIIHL